MKKEKGFSVAEAMITLLIVSIALAAMAPIFSKKAKQINTSDCLWLKTIFGGHIVRPTGNVGIGMASTTNPDSKLEYVKSDKKEALSLFFVINSFGTTFRNIPVDVCTKGIFLELLCW